MKNITNRIYRFDDFRLETGEGTLRRGDREIHLTPKAFDTLVVLLGREGKVVEKDTLLKEVWGDTFVGEATLAQNISTLRKALGTSGSGEQFIETVSKRGYKFVAAVTETVIGDKDASVGPAPRAYNDSRNKPPRRPARFRFLAALFLLGAVLSLSFFLIRYFRVDPPPPPAAGGLSVKSIAVLPFRALDERSDEEKLGFALTDAIISRLSRLKEISVRPTSAVFPYVEHRPSSSIEAGKDLGVEAVLEGTVQRDGESIRVSVQLIAAGDGAPIWAETFNEKSADVFAVQDSISGRVAQSLSVKLTPEQKIRFDRRPTSDRAAFESYELGVYLWNSRTRENLHKAAGYFEKAVETDPKFAQAYAMLADTYNLIGADMPANREELLEKAESYAARALALDNSIAEAHLVMAAVQGNRGNPEGALAYFENAVKLAPNNSTARVRYAWCLFRSQPDRSLSEMEAARSNDPLSPVTNGALCNLLTYREDFVSAVQVCKKAVELSPNTANNRLSLAAAYFFNGNPEDAIEQAKIDFERGEQKNSALGALGYFYAKSGRRREADAVLTQLRREVREETGLFADLTLITYALGRKDESFAYFKQVCEKKILPVYLFRNDPAWKEIRNDPRFAKLREKS